MQINHVLAEAHQHLRRGLAADATVDVRLARKILIEMPDVGDGVAEEHDARLVRRRRRQRSVGLAIARQLAVVVGEDRDTPRPVGIKPGEARGGDAGSWNQLRGRRLCGLPGESGKGNDR
jgi:hypothetical protein